MATIDLTGIIQALINGLSTLKVDTPASVSAPKAAPPVSTITLSAFTAMPPSTQVEVIANGVRIVLG
jgi:hypothetical protein